MATMLATFDIKKAVNIDEGEITPVVELTPGLTSHPTHFPCVLSVRSEFKKDLIERSLRST